MAPKKGQKMSLGAFLEDSTLGSWADEMDALPTAPAVRSDDEKARMDRGFDRSGRDYGTRPERVFPQREELPIPTEPPYTAFIGNLPYDLTEDDLGQLFSPLIIKSVKLIKDRDDRPKGFGYVEFEDVESLKEALSKSGTHFQNRPVRVSVASPQQSKSAAEDDKFDSPWRRDGPLPSRGNDVRSSRFERDEKPSSVSDTASDWRSNRAPPPPRFEERLPKRSGPHTPTESSPADLADTWTKGSKFVPTAEAPSRGRFGGKGERDFSASSFRNKEASSTNETGDWRSAMRTRSSEDKSPSTSTPPTPVLGRRKLELAPRSTSGGNSAGDSPLASPKMRANPFGAAKPVDVSARENEVAERLQKDRENLAKSVMEKAPVGRTPSKTPRERESVTILQNPNPKEATSVSSTSPVKSSAPASTVRAALSFANVASSSKKEAAEEEMATAEVPVDDVTAKVEDMII